MRLTICVYIYNTRTNEKCLTRTIHDDFTLKIRVLYRRIYV